MYQRLLRRHFESSVPEVQHIPIPRKLRGVLKAALFLHNPQYPRHFLNGCYLFLHEIPTGKYNAEGTAISSSDFTELVFRQLHCSEERWRRLAIWNTSELSKSLPFNFKIRVLGWNWDPSCASPSAFRSEGSYLVMSLKPSIVHKLHGTLRYCTQISSNSRIIDGTSYFCSNYPAKSTLCEHEQTLAWVCGDSSSPVGYIQYVSLENKAGESEALITGLAVEEAYQRRGFAQGLVCSVICRVSHCKEIWIAVAENNEAALRLYLKCGFAVRGKQWDSFVSLSTPGPV